MLANLAFGRTGLSVDLPQGFEYTTLESPVMTPLADARVAIENALARPNAGPALAEMARGKRSAAISVCDITRPAPYPVTLPPVLRALEDAGIPREGIRIMSTTGLHRPATDAEICQIVGKETAAAHQVLNHDARN